MVKKTTYKDSYRPDKYCPNPTKLTRYLRVSVVWQMYRFLIVNMKMLKLMANSHH